MRHSRFVGVEEVTRETCKFAVPDELQVFLTPLQAFSRRGEGGFVGIVGQQHHHLWHTMLARHHSSLSFHIAAQQTFDWVPVTSKVSDFLRRLVISTWLINHSSLFSYLPKEANK